MFLVAEVPEELVDRGDPCIKWIVEDSDERAGGTKAAHCCKSRAEKKTKSMILHWWSITLIAFQSPADLVGYRSTTPECGPLSWC